jgi:outer membrane protein assembly factor BamB
MSDISRRQALSTLGGVAAAGGLAAATFKVVPANAAPRLARPGAAESRTATLLWRQQAGSGANMNIVAADGVVYASSSFQANGNAETYAIDGATGKVAWRARGPYPAAAGTGAVFGFEIADGTTSIAALSAATGQTAWRYQAGPFLEYAVAGWMACSGDLLYIASGTTSLAGIQPVIRALDARTGHRVWAASLSSRIQVPALASGVLYGCSEGRVVALDGATGTRRWESAPIGGVMSALEAVDGVVCGNTTDTSTGTTSFFALDGDTGRPLWHGSGDLTASAGGVIFFAAWNNQDGAAVSAFHARTGRPAWARSYATAGPLTAVGDVLYLADNATLTALAPTTGATDWTYVLDHEVWWVVADAGVVYACDAKGGVYALRP